MRRLAFAVAWLAVVALLWAIGVAGGSGASKGAAHRAVYATSWDGSLDLVRVDRDSLRPRAGRRVPLAGEPLGWSYDRNRSRLALASVAHGARLRLVDLKAMRALGDVRLTRRGSVVATAWASPNLVIAVIVTPGCCGVGDTIITGVHATRRHVLWRRTLGGSLQAGARVDDGVVLVLGLRGRSLGPSRIVRIGPRGEVRSAPLSEIRSGTEQAGRATRVWKPGLAVDRHGGRAFVVQSGAPLAEVDLGTLDVRWRRVDLDARAADATTGPTREALWLGHAMLAVTGVDRWASGPAGRGVRDGETPAGLTLVDTSRWSARAIDRRITDIAVVSRRLLASSFLDQGRSGSGLTAYSTSGKRIFHRYGDEPITGVQALGRRAMVGTRRGIAVIDARSGRELRRARPLPFSLLTGDAPFP